MTGGAKIHHTLFAVYSIMLAMCMYTTLYWVIYRPTLIYMVDMILNMSTKLTKQEMGKMVRIDDDVHEDLTKLGSKNESYSMIIRRLINFYKSKQK